MRMPIANGAQTFVVINVAFLGGLGFSSLALAGLVPWLLLTHALRGKLTRLMRKSCFLAPPGRLKSVERLAFLARRRRNALGAGRSRGEKRETFDRF